MGTATDIYIAVKKMVDDANRQLEADDALFGDVHAYARVENERNGMLRVLHMLQDDFGVMRPWPSLTDHLQRRADEIYAADRAEDVNLGRDDAW